MLRHAALFLVLFAPFGLAAMAAPLTLAQGASVVDSRGVYLVVSRAPDASAQALENMGVKSLGPVSAPFAHFAQASPEQHRAARDAGYLLIPANHLAAICGIQSKERVR